jgi:uncharacterized protein
MKKSKSALHHHAHMRAATRRSAAARDALAFEVRRSRIHGRGVYATRRIPAGSRVVEYVGERISHEEADARYEDKGADDGHTFLFVVDDDTCIDAGVDGNEARYINHSCNPNCETIIEDGHVYIDAIRDIRPGEELGYDYQLTWESTDEPAELALYACRCGAAQCRGTMLDPVPLDRKRKPKRRPRRRR